MPVRLSSRYATVPTLDVVDAQGVSHPTIGIRPNTPLPTDTVVYHHLAVGAESLKYLAERAGAPLPIENMFQHYPGLGVESLEYLAWRFFGSSAVWWQIADTNPLVFPLDLPSGSVVAIAGPGEVGLIERTRRF
jgi:hypothetical protein